MKRVFRLLTIGSVLAVAVGCTTAPRRTVQVGVVPRGNGAAYTQTEKTGPERPTFLGGLVVCFWQSMAMICGQSRSR